MTTRLASIIINNYNYEPFLKDAINSALGQHYPYLEIIVVDDGSCDNSRVIISSFGDKIIPVFKANGGQASAFNAGFDVSRGDVIFFLDSDDLLFPTAVQNVMKLFNSENIAKVHWPLYVIDEQGVNTGKIKPGSKLPEGNFQKQALISGPPFCLSPPTSGNAWSRKFLNTILPMPEIEFKIGADTYLFELAPFFGPIQKVDMPQGCYRVHSRNNFTNKTFNEKLQLELNIYDSLFKIFKNYCGKMGLQANPQIWREHSWFHRLKAAIEDIKQRVPENDSFILIDDNTWGLGDTLEGRFVYPFPQENGYFSGAPADDTEAIFELQNLSKKQIGFLIFSWGSFWWLRHYEKLHMYLRFNYTCILENERVIIFNIKDRKDDDADNKNILNEGFIHSLNCTGSNRTTMENDFPPSPVDKIGWPWTIAGPANFTSEPQKSNLPLISIITPSYNQGKFLEQTIRSVLLQNYPNLEFIIIDGGSSDNSVEIIKKYEKYLTYWVSEPDRGQSHAINKGFAKSTGQILAWLNSDDYYTPGTLNLVADQLFDKTKACAVVGHCLKIFTDGTPSRNDKGCYESLFRLLQFWKGYTMPQSSIFWRREVFDKVGFLNEEHHYIMDFDYWVRIAVHYDFKNIDQILSCATYHDNAKTGDNYKIYHKQLRRHAHEYWKTIPGIDNKVMEMSLSVYDKFRNKVARAIDIIANTIPGKSTFILVDEDQWETDQLVAGHNRIPFLERYGRYNGQPADDMMAIEELERLKKAGAEFIFFPWHSFWWLDHYSAMHNYLTSNYKCILNNRLLKGFFLQNI